MEGWTRCYAPQEAWEILQERREACYDNYAALYSGNVRSLIRTAPRGSFWARPGKSRVHVPLAADLAATSANLLFGEEPRFSLRGTDPEGKKHERLKALLDYSSITAVLCEAAESASAMGDVCLKLSWSLKSPCPLLSVVQAMASLPEYRMGHLHCLHFFTVLREDKAGHVWRVWEQYRPGRLDMRMFEGSRRELGRELPGDALLDLGFEPVQEPGVEDLLAVHVPNMRPNRFWPDSGMGRSDLEGMRGLMDALDEVCSSWMRDIRLAKSRLIVPAEYLRRRPRDLFREGQFTYEFDEDVETLVALDMDTSHSGQAMITPSQFRIRTEEHRKTCEYLIRSIVSMAGYSPQSFGMDLDGSNESGAALQLRERRSYATRGKKENYWKAPLEQILTAMVHLDGRLNPGVFTGEDRVSVLFPDATANDLTTTAGAVRMLREAGVMSVEEGVSMVHPDWSRDMVEKEITRIREKEEEREGGAEDGDSGA